MICTKTKITLFIVFIVSSYSLLAQTTLCWDTSQSMSQRNLEKDFSVLEHIFKKNPDQEVQLLLFDIEITEKTYRIVEGNWQQLKNDLSNQVYDGGNVYAHLKNRIKHENVFVFTDGRGILQSDNLPLKPMNVIINSSADRNIDFLNRTALLTKSRLMDFASMLPKNRTQTASNPDSKTINGTIYIDNQPMPNVRVAVKGSENITSTDDDGNFTLNAQVGDSILVSNVANKTYKIIPVRSETTTKVFLESNVYSLDEVVVVEKRRKEKLVNTALGEQNKDKLGYDVQSIGDEEITEINTNVSDAIVGKFAGVTQGGNDEAGGGRVSGRNDLSQVVIRGGSQSLLGNNYGLIVMDGVPLRQSNSGRGEYVDTSWINPSNIADITVLKGLAATNRYGTLGANGVILITTKNAVAGKGANKINDQARLKNNFFDGKLNIKSMASIAYIQELASLSNFKDAHSAYLRQHSKYSDVAPYYLDVYNFFRPGNAKLAIRIASNMMERDTVTYEQLRALFLKACKNKDYKLQHLVAKKILEDFPEKIQSYYDIALAHINSGEYQFALNTFLSILNGSANLKLKFEGLHKRVKTELKDLIRKHGMDLDLSQVPHVYLNSTKYNARLVFDWSDQDAEFDIQFVNPQNRFFEWEHTNLGNNERIEDELRNGYLSEQFLLTGDGIEGKWIVNISYRGKRTNVKDDMPTFIKCRLDYNYGSPNSRSEEYELRLTDVSDRQFFFDFKI